MRNNKNSFGNYPSTFNSKKEILFNGDEPKAGFFNHNFMNRNNLLHNNLENILLNEEIKEYSIIIDSKDRNYQIYTNPFSYKVRFDPLPTKKEKTQIFEEPNPTIYESFKNVRYIKLEDVVLPFYTTLKKTNRIVDDEEIETFRIDESKSLTDNLYVVVSIKEFSNINRRSTNDVLSSSFATIYYDTHINNTHYRGWTRNGIKVFDQDKLGEIKSLTIDFMDPYGNKLCAKHLNKNIKSPMECICEEEYEEDCFIHNIFHPLNPMFQHHLHFRVGVVEPSLNKKTFY